MQTDLEAEDMLTVLAGIFLATGYWGDVVRTGHALDLLMDGLLRR